MIYRLGVDGGGTKTEAILLGPNGEVVAQKGGGGCNPSLFGTEGARRIVIDILRDLLSPIAEKDPQFKISHTLLCTAGNRAFWQEFAKSLTTFGKVTAVDDSVPVLELATGGAGGVVLHAGTGSFVAARENPADGKTGAVHYAGGLGWRFGDPGSGYDIARRGIARALLEMQGWLPAGKLSAYMQEQTGITEHQAMSRFFYNDSASNPKIAQFASGVLELAEQNDPIAVTIVKESTGELLDLAIKVATKLFPLTPLAEIPTGLSGPILLKPKVTEILAQGSALKLRPIHDSPIEGVRRLLVKL